MKKSILYLALLFSAAGVMFYLAKSNRLQNKLAEAQAQQSELIEKLGTYEQLVLIDSMLLKGQYDSAIESYSNSLSVQKEHKLGIPLRIALAQKLQQEVIASANATNIQTETEVVLNENLDEAQGIQKIDSLNFSLEKTKVQLARLKRQLKNKSFGEYLTFKSKKGNQMHYVGQVKNGKANGFGITLLDTGSRYEGQWKDNVRHGEGTFYWSDGSSYVGTYENDKRSGFGTYYWPNGEKYAGEWKEDKRSGTGKIFGTDGDVVAGGEWNDDELVKVNKK